MGYIRRIDSNADIQSFPGAKFEIVGDVPAQQCSEAKIEATTAQTISGPNTLLLADKFIGFDLTGKVCHITVSPTGNPGNYGIATNGDNFLILDADPGNSLNVEFYVSDGGSLILTRNLKSFTEFIRAAGYAHTTKGGKLYTNMPNGLIKEACTILFDPLK